MLDLRMKLFPHHWANEAAELEVVEAPIGQLCLRCEQPIAVGEEGLIMLSIDSPGFASWRPWHRACFLESVGVGCKRCGSGETN